MAFPTIFLERLSQMFPETKQFQDILDSMNSARKLTIRVNRIKSKPEDVLRHLEELNILFSAVPWYEDAIILENISTKELSVMPVYKNGMIYIQSLSSMIPAIVMNPDKNDKILDIAAAPGSKTTQIAAMMKNTGEIIANDVSRERLFKLKANIIHQGVTNVKITNTIGQNIWQKYPEYFDKVLVDAPCSMEGRFNADDVESYADWSMKKIKRLSKLQKWLLRSAVSATKVGGTIVYSTCTLAPEENEEVIQWILNKESAHIILEDITLKDLPMNAGLTMWNNDKYSADLTKTKRIVPSNTMEGFFIAKIKKVSSNVY